LESAVGHETTATLGGWPLCCDQTRNVALDVAYDLDGDLREREMSGGGKEEASPDIAIGSEGAFAEHVTLGFAEVRQILLMEPSESHGSPASRGRSETLPVLELASQLERRQPDIFDFLDGHLGVQRGDRVPVAMVPHSDSDGGLANAEADESLASLQDVVAGLGRGGLTEGLFDDSRIDPGHRGMGGDTGHHSPPSRSSLGQRRAGRGSGTGTYSVLSPRGIGGNSGVTARCLGRNRRT
jgi:hypothetical protein